MMIHFRGSTRAPFFMCKLKCLGMVCISLKEIDTYMQS